MSGRPRKISVYQVKNKFFLKFYDNEGVRRNKSSGSNNPNDANLLKKELDLLQINPEAPVSAKAKKLYFNDKVILPAIEPWPENDSFMVIAEYQNKIRELQAEVDRLRDIETKHIALLNTVEGNMAKHTETAPTISEALEKYQLSIQHLARYKRNYYNFIETFFEEFGLHKKIYEVTAESIYYYLENDSLNNENPPARWNRQRKQFTKFFNWSCGLWVFHDPMNQVPTKKESQKVDIHWHDLTEVSKLIKKQKDAYHKAMLSTLFFSGVSAHEFRGLKYEDYFKLNKEWYLRVTPNEIRNIKASKRRRNIPVGGKLKAALDKYIKKHPGGPALFPPLVKKDNRKFWHDGTFSRYMNLNIFPEKMNCLSTRRTYGSLQLRDGKTVAEVASLMGNSIKMVETHYARIISSELKSNL
jgi:integrase